MTDAPAGPTRLVELEGCFNFRDLGGYVGRDGRTVMWRRLYRADGLSRLTDTDLEALQRRGLRACIDLRTLDEVQTRGRLTWADGGLAWHHLPLLDVLPPPDRYPEWADPEHAAEQYLSMLGAGRGSLARAFAVLSDSVTYPAVFHCMAGKDRTGILAALILSMIGVDEEDIVADYALSAAAMVRSLAWLRAEFPDRAGEWESSAAAVVAADPLTMRLFLEGLRKQWGGPAGYATSLGLPDVPDDLAALLLES